MEALVQSIFSGILLGGLYAVVGVGLSIVFGIMGLTNIAHGNMMIMCSFLIMVFGTMCGGNIIVMLLLAIVCVVVFGFLFQNFLVNKVIDKGANPALLVTFGISIVIQNVLTLIFGADSRSLQNAFSTKNIVSTDWISISGGYLLDFVVAVIVILALSFFIKSTRIGRAIRASSNDVRAAELMGVNTKMMYTVTMCIAMVTACIAGLLVGQTFVFYPYSGPQYLIIAFGVVVIGGMGSIPGTLLGGIILGLAQLLGSHFFGPGYQVFCGYIVMLILLTVCPAGLLGNAKRK